MSSPQRAELVARMAAQRDLISFCTFVDDSYEPEPVHIIIARAIQDLINDTLPTKSRGLIINIPPQVGKSELCSVKTPAMFFGKRPNDSIILTSYGSDLAESKSFAIRETLKSDSYKKLFPEIELHPASQAVDNWRLNTPFRGFLKTAGVNGPINGLGCNLAILDDPYKDWQEANSAGNRKKVRDWFYSTLRSRMLKNSKLLLPMTRWHPDDIAGTLIPTGRYVVLRIPAIAEDQKTRDAIAEKMGQPIGLPDPLGREEGDSIAPNRFPISDLLEKKEDMGPLIFGSLYQGNPKGVENGSLIDDMFVRAPLIPLDVINRSILIRYWDKAGTEDNGKYTAGVFLAFDPTDQLTWIDSNECAHFQFGASRRELAIKDFAQRDFERYHGRVKTFVEQEPASGGKEQAENTIWNLAGFDINIDLVRTNKDVRFTPFASKIQQRKVIITHGQIGDKLIEEAIMLPSGKYRDLTDAAAGAWAKAVKTVGFKTITSSQKIDLIRTSDNYLRRLYE